MGRKAVSSLPKGPGGQDPPSLHHTSSSDYNNTTINSINNHKRRPANSKLDLDQEFSEAEADTTNKDQPDLDTDADIDADEMPKKPPPFPKRDADISMILNQQQRIQLDSLNQAIIANIEVQVMKPFNFLDHPVAKLNRVKIWNFGPAVAAQNPQPSSTDDATANDTPQVIKVDVNSVQATSPSMNILKEEATQYFNKWKTTFLKRCNDLVVPKQPNFDAGSSRQGQGPNRGGGAGAGRGGRHQQEVNKGNAYQADLYMIRRFPPVETPLCNLPVDKRRALIHAMVLMLLSTEHYISYSRLYLMYLASSLHIPSWVLIEDENRIACGLGKIYKTLCEEAEVRELEEKKALEEQLRMEEAQKAADCEQSKNIDQPETKENDQNGAIQEAIQTQEAKVVPETNKSTQREPKKKWRPNPNPVQVGNTLLAVGIGMIPEGQGLPAFRLPPTTVAHLLGPLGDCETAVGIFFGVNPNKPSSRSIDSLVQVIGDGAFIPLHCSVEHPGLRDSRDLAPSNRRMRLVICINGLLMDEGDVINPWKCLGHHNEIFTIRWENESLEKIGGAFETLLRSKVWPESLEELRRIPLATTMALQAWPDALMRCSKIVDNAWVMGFTKCPKLQQVLTDIIGGHVMGERGITLIGYGLGARSIYLCLSFLAERKMYGLVDSVIMMGAPIPSDAGTWSALKSVVSGRLVNVYSQTDYMLAFASRQMAIQFGIAGLSEIKGVGGVENHYVGDILDAHLRYPSLVPAILKRIGWEDLKEDMKAPPPQPKLVPPAAHRAPIATHKFPGQASTQGKGKGTASFTENKENTLPQRGGKTGRGGGRGGARGGYGHNDKRLVDELGKMTMK